ncbi:flagellar hook-associated protein FlgK [Roseomonas sp. BN140053]|uniref:flagellar hook-associated protein FlgK n=1 Tax=Roseomonas sp. BN140053 TaxID=3391898 RepID=UPI0039EB3877
MSLDTALSIARGGLSLVQRQLAQSADNVSNAGTAGYTRKAVDAEAMSSGSQSFGVRALAATRDVDAALNASLNAARSANAAAVAREAILSPVERAQGNPEDASSVGDLSAALNTAFVRLRASPAEPALQQGVLSAAEDLAGRYNDTAKAIVAARQAAHDGMVQDIATLNTGLHDVAGLNAQIIALSASGQSTAALQDQRDAAVARISEVLEVRTITQPDGAISLIGRGGVSLLLGKGADDFSLQPASIGAGSYHGAGGSIPGVMLGGVDVTSQLKGGRLAEYASLRDALLPQQQAELDISAAAVASRLDAQGLTLFTGGGGAVPDPGAAYSVPTNGLIGFSGTIRVGAGVRANLASVRDGTHGVTAVPGGASAFSTNPSGGPQGFTTLIDRVLTYGFGAEVAAGTSQPTLPGTGLGPDGSLTSGLGTARTVQDYAARLVASHTAARAGATAAKEAAGTLLTGLEKKFDERSGVNVDSEMAAMVTLQNAYAANARVMSTVQAMYDSLFAVSG